MYRLDIISEDESTVTAALVPMDERRYVDEDGHLVIEYV
jgi:hypothetical protein